MTARTPTRSACIVTLPSSGRYAGGLRRVPEPCRTGPDLTALRRSIVRARAPCRRGRRRGRRCHAIASSRPATHHRRRLGICSPAGAELELGLGDVEAAAGGSSEGSPRLPAKWRASRARKQPGQKVTRDPRSSGSRTSSPPRSVEEVGTLGDLYAISPSRSRHAQYASSSR